MKDLFGEVGPVDYLKERFELTANDVVEKIEKCLKRKNKYIKIGIILFARKVEYYRIA